MWRKRKEKVTRIDATIIEIGIYYKLIDNLTKSEKRFVMDYTLKGYTDSFKQQFKLENGCLQMKTEMPIHDEQYLRKIHKMLVKNLERMNMIRAYILFGHNHK